MPSLGMVYYGTTGMGHIKWGYMWRYVPGDFAGGVVYYCLLANKHGSIMGPQGYYGDVEIEICYNVGS